MPRPWRGMRESGKPARALAYRKGHSDHLLLLRADEPIEEFNVVPPPKTVLRFVRWDFRSNGNNISPFHNAGSTSPPRSLLKDELLTLWLSRKVAPDAPIGENKVTLTISYKEGRRKVELITEVLPLKLSGERRFGFYPMGEGKEGVKRYFGWNDQRYYTNLPRILRTMGEFGTTVYPLDIRAIRTSLDAEGKVVLNGTEFTKEAQAVRASGVIETVVVGAPIQLRPILRKIQERHKLIDEFEAWEYIIPEMRKLLKELGLERRILCRYADEIADYELWLPCARVFKRCCFKMTLAINAYGVNWKRLAIGTVDFWIPLYNFFLNRWGKPIADDDPMVFSKKFREACHKRGKLIYPYVCGPGPYGWSTRPRSQACFLAIDAFMKGADGLSYCGGWYWSHSLDPAYR